MAALPASLDEWGVGSEAELSTIPDCLCPACGGGNATTLCLPTKVAFFREIIVMNLNCRDCGFVNSEVSFGGEIQTKGIRMTLDVRGPEDMNRQVIKSDSCTLLLPSLELEIPPVTQRGQVTTLEGVLRKCADQLQEGQAARAMADVDVFLKIQSVIDRLKKMIGDGEDEEDDDDDDEGEEEPVFPFSVIVDDPSGNSYIENFLAPAADPQLTTERYVRSATQDMSIGLQPSAAAVEAGVIDDSNPSHKAADGGGIAVDADLAIGGLGREEVMRFPTECPHCNKASETNMCVTNIPHFKEVIIMSLDCEHCGYKSNEVKGGGAIPAFGSRIELKVGGPEDYGREILKSDTAGLRIPELELELEEGSLDGVYSTVEGLMKKLVENLMAANPFAAGDSSVQHHGGVEDGVGAGAGAGAGGSVGPGAFGSDMGAKYKEFMSKLEDLANAERWTNMKDGEGRAMAFTLIVDDPLSNSFIGPVPSDAAKLALKAEEDGNVKCYDDYVDDGLKIVEYKRTDDQDEILGLKDMKVEGYGNEGGGHGTDVMGLPDRLENVHKRGPDHPHNVAMGTTAGETTVMGEGSVVMGIPGMGARGEFETEDIVRDRIIKECWNASVREKEERDEKFVKESTFVGPKEGMIFKLGMKGLGYYTDY